MKRFAYWLYQFAQGVLAGAVMFGPWVAVVWIRTQV